MNTMIKLETVEQLCNSLNRDYKNLRKAVMSEDPDNRTISMLNRLGRTVEDTKKILTELSKECFTKK